MLAIIDILRDPIHARELWGIFLHFSGLLPDYENPIRQFARFTWPDPFPPGKTGYCDWRFAVGSADFGGRENVSCLRFEESRHMWRFSTHSLQKNPESANYFG